MAHFKKRENNAKGTIDPIHGCFNLTECYNSFRAFIQQGPHLEFKLFISCTQSRQKKTFRTGCELPQKKLNVPTGPKNCHLKQPDMQSKFSPGMTSLTICCLLLQLSPPGVVSFDGCGESCFEEQKQKLWNLDHTATWFGLAKGIYWVSEPFHIHPSYWNLLLPKCWYVIRITNTNILIESIPNI